MAAALWARGGGGALFQALRGPRRSCSSFRASQLQIQRCSSPRAKPEPESLTFGRVFTDHVLSVEWSCEGGWGRPQIHPFQELRLHPASSGLHYGIQLFEGMKAYRGADDKIRLFRPQLNMERMTRSAARVCLPPFDEGELLECIRELLRLEQDWVPRSETASLYIRPTYVGTEPSLGVAPPGRALLFVLLSPVGPYFPGGHFTPVGLLADPSQARAWPGGPGDCKLGGNYGPTIALQQRAQARGCQQVLWLHGPQRLLTEIGAMNVFVFWNRPDGEPELVTPPLDGLILPGVTRRSILDLAREWGEFGVREGPLPMAAVLEALRGGRLREMFGSGTACMVCPVGGILYEEQWHPVPTMENGAELTQRFRRVLSDIQYGHVPSEWAQPL
ncbi:branched-chain-amino-acid aminotransferase, mitochondrial-like isoform X1 [Cuculus canorus]|uniref:branched-chain-amino-acid aminotransferase, mitochondrial-like isoform X1 n=1 Tax=Cuculus canorus TaxID=55661 RepID=UPI0023AA59E1|nr:branched-chain-amino-acid aminotransferase, mitochondrial-like isoform X1 [Cuculus canorus]